MSAYLPIVITSLGGAAVVVKVQLPVHTLVVEYEPRTVGQAFALLVDIDDEEGCNACEREPITLNGLKRLCHGLAVDLAQRFDGITTATGGGNRWKIGVASLAAARG